MPKSKGHGKLLSEESLKQVIPILLYLLFLSTISTIAVIFTYLPMFLFYEITQIFYGAGNISFIFQSIALSIIPIALLLFSYKFTRIIKDVNKYFFAMFLIVLASYIFYFYGALEFTSSNIVNLAKLAFLILTYIIYLSAALTYLWKRIIREKRYIESFLLIFPFLLIIIILLGPFNPFSLQVYIDIGEFILKWTNINIFYLDYGGFGVILLSFIVSIAALVSNLLYRFINSKKI